MVVAVAGGPPAGDAVDQLAPVGEREPRAFACRPPAAAAKRSSSGHRAARCGRCRPRTRRAACCFCSFRPPFHASSPRAPRILRNCALKSRDDVARSIRARQTRRSRAPQLAPRAGRDLSRGRHLGRARRQAAAVVFLQRLSQSHAASGRQKGGGRGTGEIRRGLRRLAADHRQSPALRRAGNTARPHQADRSGGRVRLGLSRQCRHHPGADRARWPGAAGRIFPCLHLCRRAIVARPRADLPA